MPDKKFSYRSLFRFTEAVSVKLGMPAGHAEIMADSLTYANLVGVDTHGVTRLAIYAKRIEAGLIDPKAEPKIHSGLPSVVVVDGANGVGQVIGRKAMDAAIEAAGRTGVGVALARNSQHFGTCSYYCQRAVERNMIGLAFTNAEPGMAAWGGRRACFGTNPIAMGCPTGKDFPILIDMATSVTARGKIIAAAKKGEKIPMDWAIDADGNPTDDAGKALAGAVLTMAQHKGYALAVMVEVLSGVLSGAGFGAGVGSMYKDFTRPANVGHFLAAIHVEALMPLREFKERVDRMIDGIKASGHPAGGGEVLIPGERGGRTRRDRQANGIPLSPEEMKELEGLAGRLGVPFCLDAV